MNVVRRQIEMLRSSVLSILIATGALAFNSGALAQTPAVINSVDIVAAINGGAPLNYPLNGLITLNPGDRVRMFIEGKGANGKIYRLDTSFLMSANPSGQIQANLDSGEQIVNQNYSAYATILNVSAIGGSGFNGPARILYQFNANEYRGPFANQGYIAIQVQGPDANSQFSQNVVNMIYRGVLFRDADHPGSDSYISRLAASAYDTNALIAETARVAIDIASSPESNQYFQTFTPLHRVGELYRALLLRQGADEDFWNQDPGFRGSVQRVQSDPGNFASVVSGVVQSPEFRSAIGR